MNRVDELAMRLADGDITGDEVRELEELLQSVAVRAEFLRLLEFEAHLRSMKRRSVATDVIRRLKDERCDRIEEGVMSVVAGADKEMSVEQTDLATSAIRRQPFLLVAASIVAVATLAFFVLWGTLPESKSPAIARLIPHSLVTLGGSKEATKRTVSEADLELPIRAGELVETTGAIDGAEILYEDGTRIVLVGGTKVKLSTHASGSKQLFVFSGLVQADVAPQPPDNPFQIVTSTATLDVVGTTLGVEVRNESTQLEVTSGLVAITRTADGKRVDVPSGTFVRATTSKDEKLAPAPLPEVPNTWSQEFSTGLPHGWQTGQLVDVDGMDAVRAAPSDQSNESGFAVMTHNAWQEGDRGLFQVHDDSVLHIRFRQDEFARIRLMVVARVLPQQKNRFGANLFYTRKAWNDDLLPQQWKTISVPLSEVDWFTQRRQRQSGDPELEGLSAYIIQVATPSRDVGLTINRMWVTRESESKK